MYQRVFWVCASFAAACSSNHERASVVRDAATAVEAGSQRADAMPQRDARPDSGPSSQPNEQVSTSGVRDAAMGVRDAATMDDAGDGVDMTPVLTNADRLGIATGAPYLIPGMTSGDYMKKARAIGVGWIRTDAALGNNPSTTFIDETLQAAQSAGLRVLVTLTYTWDSNGGDHNNPVDHAAWAKYAGTLVDHWEGKFPQLIGAYEIWNEANGSDFFHPTNGSNGNAGAAAYCDLLRKTYAVLHPKVGSTPILTSGTAAGDGNGAADTKAHPLSPASWLDALYTCNGGTSAGLFDAVSHHPYQTKGEANHGSGSGYTATAFVRAVMNSHGDKTKQIWATEVGWPSCTPNFAGDEMTEGQRATRFDADVKDWFYGLHDEATGLTKGYADNGDWNVGPWMMYKLYKNYDNAASDPGYGLIDGPKDSCKGGAMPKAYFEPAVVGKIAAFAAAAQTTIGP